MTKPVDIIDAFARDFDAAHRVLDDAEVGRVEGNPTGGLAERVAELAVREQAQIRRRQFEYPMQLGHGIHDHVVAFFGSESDRDRFAEVSRANLNEQHSAVRRVRELEESHNVKDGEIARLHQQLDDAKFDAQQARRLGKDLRIETTIGAGREVVVTYLPTYAQARFEVK